MKLQTSKRKSFGTSRENPFCSFIATEATPFEVEDYIQTAARDNDFMEQDMQSSDSGRIEEPQIRQSSHLLVAQPSIEITPASEYNGSQDKLDHIGGATPEIPKTPSSGSDHNDDSGHPTEHDGVDSDNQFAAGDDIEVIPPPTRHSPLTDQEEHHYHLPESPDPNAHNTIIPEQHVDDLIVPDIEDTAPRDHFPGNKFFLGRNLLY